MKITSIFTAVIFFSAVPCVSCILCIRSCALIGFSIQAIDSILNSCRITNGTDLYCSLSMTFDHQNQSVSGQLSARPCSDTSNRPVPFFETKIRKSSKLLSVIEYGCDSDNCDKSFMETIKSEWNDYDSRIKQMVSIIDGGVTCDDSLRLLKANPRGIMNSLRTADETTQQTIETTSSISPDLNQCLRLNSLFRTDATNCSNVNECSSSFSASTLQSRSLFSCGMNGTVSVITEYNVNQTQNCGCEISEPVAGIFQIFDQTLDCTVKNETVCSSQSNSASSFSSFSWSSFFYCAIFFIRLMCVYRKI